MTKRYLVLQNWDKTKIDLPFSRITWKVGAPIYVDKNDDLHVVNETLKCILNELELDLAHGAVPNGRPQPAAWGRKFRRIGWQTAAAFLLSVALYAGWQIWDGNFHTVLAGKAYRSAQPTDNEILRWHKKYGIKFILNLRGAHPREHWYQAESQEAKALGIKLVNDPISSRHQLSGAQVQRLVWILHGAHGPILIHCASGADRSGLVSALYLASVAHASEARAEWQLSAVFGHISLWFLPAYAMNRTWEAIEPSLGYEHS